MDHIGFAVADFERSKPFFVNALAPLDITLLIEVTAEQGRRVLSGRFDRGRRDNGPPGLRPQYRPNYYGAFILDADGNNIEAVCHQSQ